MSFETHIFHIRLNYTTFMTVSENNRSIYKISEISEKFILKSIKH